MAGLIVMVACFPLLLGCILGYHWGYADAGMDNAVQKLEDFMEDRERRPYKDNLDLNDFEDCIERNKR